MVAREERGRWGSATGASRDLPVVERRPVESAVPLVLLDVLRAVLGGTNSPRAVDGQQLANQLLGLLLEVLRVLALPRQDLLVDLELVL